MKHLISLSLCLSLTGCASWIPGLTQAIDDAVTDDACSVTVNKAGMQPNTDVDISVSLKPHSTTPPAPVINVHTQGPQA